MYLKRLTISLERESIVLLPNRATRRRESVVLDTLTLESTCFTTSSSKSTKLSMLVLAGYDPVDARISSDRSMAWIDCDDFKVFVSSIFSNPVGVEYPHVRCSASDTFFGKGLEASCRFHLVDTLVDRFTVHNSLGVFLLTSSTADTGSEYSKALLGLKSKTAGLVRAGKGDRSVDSGKLAVLPGS